MSPVLFETISAAVVQKFGGIGATGPVHSQMVVLMFLMMGMGCVLVGNRDQLSGPS